MARAVPYEDRVVVIDQVPALVCRVCGHAWVSPEVERRVESLARMANRRPKGWVPVFTYESWI